VIAFGYRAIVVYDARLGFFSHSATACQTVIDRIT
jgi:hypothetical protein